MIRRFQRIQRRRYRFFRRFVLRYYRSGLRDIPLDAPPRLPRDTFELDRHGLARVLSVPAKGDAFESDILSSYRCKNGVLHNPKHDRRTTKGVFHVVEGGLAIPADKTAVPKVVFANMLAAAMNPPAELLRLPFTAAQENKAECWVSLLLRPVVSPEVPGFIEQKSLEVRFFAPGNCVCNLDFVESIFGNGGDPYLIGNDASLDPDHWTGHTGCVILAPHILGLPKKQLGLPHTSQASEQQKATGMCWENPDEPYNDGGAFKLTARDSSGVIVTLIADNYFGYCKKEIKTQISFSANLYGMVEEEHAGGAIAFANYDLGEEFCLTDLYSDIPDWDSFVQAEGELFHLRPEGYGVDRKYPDISYIPGHAQFSLQDQRITWTHNQQERSTRLRPGISYVLPNGYRVEMVRPHAGRRWRLIGTASEGTFCHKPCTVSGGGKSEISKSIADAILTGPVFVADFKRDFDLVEQIIERDYSGRFADPALHGSDKRPLLSPQRSLGSVVKLLTPSSEYSQEYNEWLQSLPFYVKELVFVVKRFFKPDWEDHWRDRFRVDIVNGVGGNELRYRDQKLMTQYARVGFTSEGQWRTYVLRKDFFPATKLQTEDDITASVVVPANQTKGLQTAYKNPSHKFAFNCENRLFQRPDEAIHRGYDSKAEADMSAKGNFFSNYQPQNREAIKDLVEDTIRFDQWTQPVKNLLTSFLDDDSPEFCVSPAHPRIVDGKPSKNPRYLQDVDLLTDPRRFYLGELATRISRGIAPGKPVPMPVNAILPGRRNNPPEPGIRPLAVYGPIHYMPLPELLQFVIESKHSRFPVYEEDLDHVIGVLHVKDLVHHQHKQKGNFDIRLLVRPAPVVPEHYPVKKLLTAFRNRRIHMAIVLDEFGGTAGVVTLEDLVEEVVGEVRDEFDFEYEPIVRLAPGVLEVTGGYLLDDLTEEVYLGEEENLPDVETVGGLIMTELGRLPDVGDKITYNGVIFTVLAVEGLAVARAKVEYSQQDLSDEQEKAS